MKAFLMHVDRDFDVARVSPPSEVEVLRDLQLDTLFRAMATDDELILHVVKSAVMAAPANDPAAIRYRQAALRDGLSNPDVLRSLYGLAAEVFERQRKLWPRFRDSPSTLLEDAAERMAIFMDVLKRLRRMADRHAAHFRSEAFSNLFAMLARELDDDYFAIVDLQLKALKFGGAVFVSAALGKGLKGERYVLRRPLARYGKWLAHLFGRDPFRRPGSYTIRLAPRDEAGARALSELRDRGLGLAADALAKSVEHIESFFRMLQTELSFYVGCLNLHERLLALGAPFAFPLVSEADELRLSCKGLYDVCLALSMLRRPVGNDVAADGKSLVIVTGANRGGKTTFLRSIGLAQLMTQTGMFAAAESLEMSVVSGVFTHFKREEDATMKSGKLDEELSRMNDIVDALRPDALILFNESFAATNEREGSEIARQIVSALLERSHRIVFVTHQFDFTHSFYERRLDAALFLRADRQADGRRTFKLIEGEPLSTSFGEDVYREVFFADSKSDADA